MIRISVDGVSRTVPEGRTIFDTLEDLMIRVPSLCRLPGYPHHTSCMVCVVEVAERGGLVPSCSVPVADGMTIVTDSQRIRDSRRTAVELLLSEHFGDCLAPCVRACPAGYRIPELFRCINLDTDAAHGTGEARRGIETMVPSPAACEECAGYCERACRRGQLDDSVRIRDTLLSISRWRRSADGDASGPRAYDRESDAYAGRSVSVRGAVTESERAYRSDFLSQSPCRDATVAPKVEAKRCLSCDCSAVDDCRLKALAIEFESSNRRYRLETRDPFVPPEEAAGAIYDGGKCIKCGRCVRVAEAFGPSSDSRMTAGSAGGKPADAVSDILEGRGRWPPLAFVRKGIDTGIGFPDDLLSGRVLHALLKRLVAVCPTGALAFPRPGDAAIDGIREKEKGNQRQR